MPPRTHAGRCVLFSDHGQLVLIGACNPILSPILGFREKDGIGNYFDRLFQDEFSPLLKKLEINWELMETDYAEGYEREDAHYDEIDMMNSSTIVEILREPLLNPAVRSNPRATAKNPRGSAARKSTCFRPRLSPSPPDGCCCYPPRTPLRDE